MKTIAITGAAGFAGYSLTTHLLQRGYKVYAITRPNSEHNNRLLPENIQRTLKQDLLKGSLGGITEDDIINILEITRNLVIVELSSENYDEIHKHVREKIDYFFHLTWAGMRDEYYQQSINVDQTIKAIESVSHLNCKRFICTGSQAEYGVRDSIITEDLCPNPDNSYGAAKVAALYLSKRRCEQLGIEWIWGRIFSLYGLYEPTGRMLPDLIANLKNGKSMQLSSCRQYWDYLDAGDAAEALIALAEKGVSGEIYNIANGEYRTLREYTESLRERINPKCNISYGDDPKPFVSLQPEVKKILADTGWFARVDFFDDQIWL